MKKKPKRYAGNGIEVEYDVARCIHAAECVHGLPEVFDPNARPWIQPDQAPADAVAEAVRGCPTGALRYRRTDGAEDERPPADNTLRIAPDGPLYLAGRLRLELADGEVVEETRVALCRCGHSSIKPFCDGSHGEQSFSDPGLAAEHRLGESESSSGGPVTIKAVPNGPVLLEGPLRVVAADDASAVGGKAALCRCGASESKPYCDGSHTAIGFEAE